MSNVKSSGNPIGKLWDSVTKEAGRIVNEAGRHVTESINDVAKGVDKGGVIGGVATALDKFSLGNIATGAVDMMIPGADLPKPLAEGISGAVNLATGNPMGYVDLIQGFMAIGGDGGVSAPGNDGNGQRTQTPESPSNAVNNPAPPREFPVSFPGMMPVASHPGGAILTKGTDGSMRVKLTDEAQSVDIRRTADGNVRITIDGMSMTLRAEDARKLVITGTNGDDRITVGAGVDNVVVNGRGGNDVIISNGNNAEIDGGRGNDTIRVTGDGTVVYGGAGHDDISNRGDNARLVGGSGNDTVSNTGRNGVLIGGKGNDKLFNAGDNGVLNGGSGHDRLKNVGDNAALIGGKGNDNLSNRGENGRVIGGPGRDTIKHLPSRLTIVPHRPEDDRVYTNFPMPPYQGPKIPWPPANALPEPTPDQACDHNEFIGRCRDKVDAGGGFASAGVLDQLDGFFAINDLLNGGKPVDTAKKKLQELESKAQEATSQLDKILNNPNLSFEDMIFLLMKTLMRQSQDEVKEMTNQIRDDKAKFESQKLELNSAVDAAESKVNELEAKVRANPDDKDAAKQLGDAKSALRKAGEDRNEKIGDFNDSRQEQLEALKNAMNKITEMQQALSNVLNSMHQTAMNTIGNIR